MKNKSKLGEQYGFSILVPIENLEFPITGDIFVPETWSDNLSVSLYK